MKKEDTLGVKKLSRTITKKLSGRKTMTLEFLRKNPRYIKERNMSRETNVKNIKCL